MQFSNESNAALWHIIRSKPTIVGQYRQAILEANRRLQALESIRFEFRKQEQELKLRQLAQTRLKIRSQQTLDALEKQELECHASIAEIEVEKALFDVEQTAKLIPDAERELRFCQYQLQQICEEFKATGFDLQALNEDQFQALMSEEFKAKLVRHWASHLIGSRSGLHPELVEAILDTPEADREYLLAASQSIAAHFLPQSQQTKLGTDGRSPE